MTERGSVVGRDVELAAVGSFLAREAGPAALIVEGEAGIGKTTIVRRALELAPAEDLRVFAARPAAGEAELPYVGLGDLLASVHATRFAVLAPPQRAALEAALARDTSNAGVDASALARALLELLRLEGADGDLLIVVDDVQWLDRATVAALTFALRRLGETPLRLLVAERTELGRGLSDPPLGLADWPNVRRLEVRPLSTTELGAVLRARLGISPPRPALEALRRESGGNPLFALELAQRDPAGPGGAVTLGSALTERMRALDSDARVAVSFAAAALRPSADVLLRAR